MLFTPHPPSFTRNSTEILLHIEAYLSEGEVVHLLRHLKEFCGPTGEFRSPWLFAVTHRQLLWCHHFYLGTSQLLLNIGGLWSLK